ncbi:MAG: FecR family protein [Candidatus Cryptobacteroides sp.]
MSRPTEKQLHKYVSGESTFEERVEITDWAAENPDNDREIKFLRKLFLASLLNTVSGTSGKHTDSQKSPAARILGRIAAVVSVAAVLSFGIFVGYRYADNEARMLFPSSIQVPEGQRTHVYLSDGTEIWINSNTKLNFEDTDKDFRRVYLDGEACFEVAHNEERPFIVETPKNKVQVLGTVFDVRAYKCDDEFVVKLYEGKVTVRDMDNSPICTLLPDEMLIACNGGYLKKPIDSYNSIDWNGGFYSFKNQSYARIFKTIGAYYNTELIVCDKEIGEYMCTARFKQEDTLNQILSSMSAIHSFRWEWSEDNSTIRIYK